MPPRFLGYEVQVLQDDRKHNHSDRVKRSINGHIGLRVPRDVVREKCKPYMRNGKRIHRAERTNDSVFSIIVGYQAEYRGVVNYYRLAYNLRELAYLHWVMETSLTKTLARKLRISVYKAYRRYVTWISTERGPRKVLREMVEREGRKPLVAH